MYFNQFDYYTSGFMIVILAVEFFYSLKKQDGIHLLSDTLSNIFSVLVHYIIIFLLAIYVLEKYYNKIYQLAPYKFPHNWIVISIGVLFVDFSLYWVHYAGHAFLWPLHCPHHSSPYYNISTGLRQSWIFTIVIAFICLPVAYLGISFETLVAVLKIVFAYSIYVHTQYIHKLPWFFENIFVAPSHHRVHHAAKREYSDKNLGGFLIIWDKLFGTFQIEDEKISYGIKPAMISSNPFKIQFDPLKKWLRKLRHK